MNWCLAYTVVSSELPVLLTVSNNLQQLLTRGDKLFKKYIKHIQYRCKYIHRYNICIYIVYICIFLSVHKVAFDTCWKTVARIILSSQLIILSYFYIHLQKCVFAKKPKKVWQIFFQKMLTHGSIGR